MTDICKRPFTYRRAVETNVLETFKRHGWQPTTPDERKRRNGIPVRLLTFDEPERASK